MEPLISIVLEDQRPFYEPGATLTCQYQVDAVEKGCIQAIEASILWYSEGKGEEDMGVHFFQRRLPSDAEGGDLRRLHRFRTVLPQSPRSYSGVLLKIRWCVRIRVFLKRGKEASSEQPFQLGDTAVAARYLL